MQQQKTARLKQQLKDQAVAKKSESLETRTRNDKSTLNNKQDNTADDSSKPPQKGIFKTQDSKSQKSLKQPDLQKQKTIQPNNPTIPKDQPILAPQTSTNETKQERLKVAVRIRPPLQREIAKELVVHASKNGRGIRVADISHMVESQYDKVFSKDAKQNEIYDYVANTVQSVLQGFNCTIFAYGQTGSGKTFTMFGDGFDDPMIGSGLGKMVHMEDYLKTKNIQNTTSASTHFSSHTLLPVTEKKGLIPRCIGDIFKSIQKQGTKMTVYCSFLQIYNEKLYDLLQDSQSKNPLQIREDRYQGIYVESLSEYVIENEQDCMVLLKRGEKNRIKRATKMNINSSRSHSLFQLLIESDQVDKNGMLKRSKLNLGDLAGSEKVNKDEEVQAKHMLELRNINLSLTSLGKVIQLLAKNSDSDPHIPFRESKLTRLLQDSLGGNTQTYLIATVSPLLESIDETISTLKFADRAKCVLQRFKKNEFSAKDDALINKLQREIGHLKELLQMKRKGNQLDISQQFYILKDENDRLRQIALSSNDVEQMKLENKIMRIELQKLRMMTSEIGSSDDNSPKLIFGSEDESQFKISPQKGNVKKIKEQQQDESDTDESNKIQKQFNGYLDIMNKKTSNEAGVGDSTGAATGRKAYLPNFNGSIVKDGSNQNSNESVGHYKRKLNSIVAGDIKPLPSHLPSKHQSLSTQFSKISLTKRSLGASIGSDNDGPGNLNLPPIKEHDQQPKAQLRAHQSLYNKFNPKVGYHNIGSPGSPYKSSGPSPSKNLQRSYDIGLSVNIPKRVPNIRMSIGEDPNRSYQQYQDHMLTQSSLYGGASSLNEDHGMMQSKTTVRIRGKHNNIVQTTGSLLRTLEEEKKMMERKRQMKRSNDRIRMLEDMELQRQNKMQMEIEKLQQERQRREEEQQRKREINKQRKVMQANVDNDRVSITSGIQKRP